MAGKTTDQTEITTAAEDDVIDIVDVSDLTDSPQGSSKKIKKSNYLKGVTRQLPGFEGYIWIPHKDNETGALAGDDLFFGAGDYHGGILGVFRVLELPVEDDSDLEIVINLGG